MFGRFRTFCFKWAVCTNLQAAVEVNCEPKSLVTKLVTMEWLFGMDFFNFFLKAMLFYLLSLTAHQHCESLVEISHKSFTYLNFIPMICQPYLFVCIYLGRLGHCMKDFHKNVRFSPFTDIVALFNLIVCNCWRIGNCYSSHLRKLLWSNPQWRRDSYTRVVSDTLCCVVEWISDVFAVFHSSLLCRRFSSPASNGLFLPLGTEALPEQSGSWAGVTEHSRLAPAQV